MSKGCQKDRQRDRQTDRQTNRQKSSAANKINGLGYPKKGLKKDSIFG